MLVGTWAKNLALIEFNFYNINHTLKCSHLSLTAGNIDLYFIKFFLSVSTSFFVWFCGRHSPGVSLYSAVKSVSLSIHHTNF